MLLHFMSSVQSGCVSCMLYVSCCILHGWYVNAWQDVRAFRIYILMCYTIYQDIFNILHYTPKSQGIKERYNSTTINMLSCYVNEDQKDRNKYVKLIMFVYNASTHASTVYSQFYLLHGFEPNQHRL